MTTVCEAGGGGAGRGDAFCEVMCDVLRSTLFSERWDLFLGIEYSLNSSVVLVALPVSIVGGLDRLRHSAFSCGAQRLTPACYLAATSSGHAFARPRTAVIVDR